METLELSILGRSYRIACEPHERAQLLACARYVDQKMEAIRAAGKVLGADRIAVMAALQIAQELMAAKNADGVSIGELRRRLRELNALADTMLAPQEPLFPPSENG
ncbi:MAG TPA: cell division protein ZapA [Burkholderiaceae bacterium]|jgi:cell division protein ZapA|nr:cell division protein ZapA [Burkholderiaceae bacterium]